jgi:SdpI/YfhL protein family
MENFLYKRNIFTALFVSLIHIPLLLKWINRNDIYGVRISAALSSEVNWYRINQKQAIIYLIFSAIYIVANIIFKKWSIRNNYSLRTGINNFIFAIYLIAPMVIILYLYD